MLKFPSIDKTPPGGDGYWHTGPDTTIDPRHVIAVEARVHRYHSFRPEQSYAVIHLSTGAVIEVMARSSVVQQAVREALVDVVHIPAKRVEGI